MWKISYEVSLQKESTVLYHGCIIRHNFVDTGNLFSLVGKEFPFYGASLKPLYLQLKYFKLCNRHSSYRVHK